MNKKVLKIANIFLIVIALVSIATNVFAVTPGNLTGDSKFSTTGIENVGNDFISIISTVGMIVSVIVLMVLGIKYMMGSAEEKAEYKKTFIPYLVGAALLFAASAFAQGIYDFVSKISFS